jgi:AcrR family transcriptional regulator
MASEPTTDRTRLSRERVLEAAIELARRDGIDALTMRRLADELEVGVMTLYHYVPNKSELLDAMVDVVFAEIELPPRGVDWRTAMRRRAVSTREALNRHRWAVGLMESRATPGPASMRVHDAVLGCLREAGFSLDLTLQAYSVLDAYIYGFALQEKTVPFDSPAQGAALAQAQAEAYAELAAAQGLGDLADEFPYLAEVVAGHVAVVGYDFGPAFELGLDLILEALERRRAAQEPDGDGP